MHARMEWLNDNVDELDGLVIEGFSAFSSPTFVPGSRSRSRLEGERNPGLVAFIIPSSAENILSLHTNVCLAAPRPAFIDGKKLHFPSLAPIC
jgi:hypothetical protein